MKISGIHIHNFYQFQDLKLNLTYPEGHQKAGQPLDKVCLIGQSGTGKTTLLELLLTAISKDVVLNSLMPVKLKKGQGISFFFGSQLKETLTLSGTGAKISRQIISSTKKVDNYLENTLRRLLYFPSNLSTYLIDKVESIDSLHNQIQVFDELGLSSFWEYARRNFEQYQLDEADYRVGLTVKAQQGVIGSDSIGNLITDWKNENPNPLEAIADKCLNPLLQRFQLAVKTTIDNYRRAEHLQIYSKQTNEVIPYHRLSSGTRQIIYTAFPIYQLLEPNAIVLMDEPENSLYPDIQQEIISYYTSFDQDKQSQFFFATHSPIIASAFEPWEVVELKFDKKGEVFRELYYEGENHIKNYHTDPRYLRWDSILTKVFDLEAEGNEPERSNMLTEFAVLKRKIKKLEKEGKLHTEKELLAEFERVGALLDWETAKN